MRGYTMNKDDCLTRLRRVEVKCVACSARSKSTPTAFDVLAQVSAATDALQAVAVDLLDEHVRHCVRNAATEDPSRADELVEEATRAIERLMRA